MAGNYYPGPKEPQETVSDASQKPRGIRTLLSEQASSATVSAVLMNATVKTAALMPMGAAASGVSAAVAALSEGTLRTMLIGKLQVVMTLLLGGFLLTGMALLLPAAARVHPETPANPPAPNTTAAMERDSPLRVDRFGDPLPDGALFRFGSVRMRHGGTIYNSALSPDGKLLATASGGSVFLWNLAEGKIVRRLVCRYSDTFCTPGLSFSPNGKYLGYVQDSYSAYLWEVKTGKEIAHFSGNPIRSYSCGRFTPDSETFILNDGLKRMCFWNVREGKESRSLTVEHVSMLSPDTRVCVRIELNKGVTFLDSKTGKETGRLDVTAQNNGLQNGIAFSPNGELLAVVHQNEQIQVRRFPSGELRVSFPLPDTTKYRMSDRDHWEYRVCFSADGRTLLLGTKAGVVHRWDLATHNELPPLKQHIGAVAGIHTLPDGQRIVTTGGDGLIRFWDRRSGRELSAPPGYAGRTHAAYSPKGRFAAVGDARGRLELWDTHSGRLLRVLQTEGPAMTKAAFAPDGQSLAAAQADHTIHFFAVPTGAEQHVLRCGKEQSLTYVLDMRFSPDGRHLLIADHNYRARMWDIRGEKVLWGASSGSLAFAPDGKTVLTQFAGPSVEVRNAADGKLNDKLRLRSSMPDNFGGISRLAYSPDGQRFAVGLYSGAVYLCEARTGVELTHFQAVEAPKHSPFYPPHIDKSGSVAGLSFSPDGRWLCTGGSDGSVRLWEVATGREVLRWNGDAGKSEEVTFGPDNRTVLSCGEDAQAYLWSLRPPMAQGKRPALASLWANLTDEPAKAYRALWFLSEAENVTIFLRGKLVPVKPESNERLRQLIADLESETFAVRDRATTTLADLGNVAAPAMRKALADRPPLETRKRLEQLLHRVEKKMLSAEELRIVRAIDTLERQDTAAAHELLKALAAGAPEALPTREAQAVLRRLPR